jgi:imidazolonepropionase-like amidohydrolase
MTVLGFRAARLFDAIDGRVRPDHVVLVDGERITAVVPAPEVPQGTPVRDFGDVTLLPGLIDAHVHVAWDGTKPNPVEVALREPLTKTTLRAARHALDTLASGTTTIRDVGAQHGVAIALREAIEEGIVHGPRMRCAGSVIQMTGGHIIGTGVEVDTPGQARRAARQQVKDGADFVKVIASGGVYGLRHDQPWAPQLTVEEMRAAVEEVEKAGSYAAIHAEGELSIANAIQAGATTIEHGNQLTEETAGLMAERGIFLVPTLAWFFGVAEAEPGPVFPAEYVRKARIMAEGSARSVALARAAGVRIAAGTDTGAPFVPHNSVRRELELLVHLGLSPAEALLSGTRVAAEAMRMHTQVGTLEAGKYADLVVVEGNPAASITDLYRLVSVVKGGRAYTAGARLGDGSDGAELRA